jgi:hypothetical protein
MEPVDYPEMSGDVAEEVVSPALVMRLRDTIACVHDHLCSLSFAKGNFLDKIFYTYTHIPHTHIYIENIILIN